MPINVLLVEDNPGDARLIREVLKEDGNNRFKLDWADRLAAGLEKLSASKPDVVILDLSLPDSQGLATFARLHAKASDVPIVVLTGLDDEEVAMQAMREGAQDYLLKGELIGALLARSLRYAIGRKCAEEALRKSREELEQRVRERTAELRDANEQLQVELAERKRAEGAALRAKQEWERTFDAVPDLVAILDDRHHILRANRAMAQHLGRSVEQCVGATCFQVVHGIDHPPAFCPHVRTMRDGLEHMSEVTEIRLGGSFLVSTTPLVDAEGKSSGSVHVARDITDCKRAEEQLRTTLESIGDGFFACDADWRFIYVNAPAERILGIRREDMLGKSFWEVFPLTLGTRLEQEFRRAAAGEITDFDNFYEPWGRWFHNRCFPREGGGLSVYFKDITERKRAEDALRASEERFRVLSEAMPQIVWSADATGAVDYLNPQASQYGGVRIEDVSGWNWVSIVHPDDLEHTEAAWRRAIATGEADRIEHRLRRADGEFRWHLTSGVPLRNEKGEVIRWIGTATDIHEQITAEQELERRVAERTAQLDSTNQELRRVNRTLKVLSECNHVLIHAEEESAFLHEVCRILVEVGGYRMAWVGYAEQGEAKKVRPVAHAGYDEGYLALVGVTWANDARGRGPTGTAIRTGQPVVNRNTTTDQTVSPWREEALKRRYASSIALPMRAGSHLWGALTVYATEPEAFDDAEIKLLSELAGDIGFGIDTIRTRVERKRTAEALEESEIRYKNFISHSIEGVWRVELGKPLPIGLPEDESLEWLFQQGYMAECNQAFARMAGFSAPDELIGKHLGDVIPASDEERIETFRSLARRGFQGQVVEFRAAEKTGNLRNLQRTDIPIVENGMLLRLWCITRDLTDIKRAEEVARKASAEIRDLYNNAPCGYHSLDKDGVFLRMNETALRWLGYTHEEVVGKLNFADILTEKSRRAFAENFPHFKATGLARDLEFELVRKDGSAFPVLLSATAVRDGDGNYVMSRSTVYDITERKRALDAAAAERQRFNDVLEMLPACVALLTPDFHVPFANRFFRERFGESQGKRCYEYLFGRNEPCENCETSTVLKNKRPHHWEWTGPDGCHYDMHHHPFTDTDGSPLILEMGIDITERKRAEESLRQLSAQLLRTQDDERRRIARELHDSIGQELTAMLLNLGWIKRSAIRLNPQGNQVLDETQELIKRCSQEVRDFSYLLHPPMLDESGLASALRWFTEGFARRTGIQIALEVPDDLLRRSREVETALFRVVQECLTNVLRHSGSPTVSIRIVQEADRLCLEVADQGRGVHVPAPDGAVPRPGIGVAGMQERMRELGGTLEMESGSHGTTVRASLPMEEEKAA